MYLIPNLSPSSQFRVNRLIWAAIAAMGLLDVALITLAGMSIEIHFNQNFILVMAACIGLALLARYWKRDDMLFFFCNVVLQLVAVSYVVSLAEYYGATLKRPLMDEAFHNIEQAIGFSWMGYTGWVNAHTSIADAFNLAYDSYNIQAALLICGLFIVKQTAHGQRFVMVGYITALITILLATLYPAMGEHIYYHLTEADFPNIYMASGWEHSTGLSALRDVVGTSIACPGPGVVMFPSYHAIMAGMLMYASLPFRYLRWLVIPANTLMLLATPTSGAHYLIDVIAGVAVLVLAIKLTERLLPRSIA